MNDKRCKRKRTSTRRLFDFYFTLNHPALNSLAETYYIHTVRSRHQEQHTPHSSCISFWCMDPPRNPSPGEMA